MPVTKVPLIGVSDSGRSPDLNSHRAINLMPQAVRGGKGDVMAWVSTPGLEEFVTTETGGYPSKVYAMFPANSTQLFGVFLVGGSYYLNKVTENEPVGADLLTLTGYSGSAPTFWARTQGLTTTTTWTAFVNGSRVYATTGSSASTSFVVTYFSSQSSVTNIVESGPTLGVYTYTVTTATAHGLSTNDTVVFKGWSDSNVTYATYTLTSGSGVTFTFNTTDNLTPPSTFTDVYAYGQTSGNGSLDFDTITSIDGYFIANTPRRVYVSYVQDPRIWMPLDFFGASRDPDAIKRVYAFGGLVYLFGETTTEAYYNGGQGTQPFIPARPVAYDWGILGVETLTEIGNGLVWLANRRRGNQSVVMLAGGDIRVISNKALEYELDKVSTTHSTAYAISYRDERGEFYQLSFLNAVATYTTWCCDIETMSQIGIPAWHERQDASGGRHRARLYTYLTAVGHVVSDHTLPEIYHLTNDASAEYDGDTVASTVDRIGYSGHIYIDGKRVIHHSVFIDMENPVGSGTCLLQWSDDGGNTYNGGISKSFTGRGTRLDFFGLGSSRYDRVYKMTFQDVNVPVNITGMYANVEVCSR